MTKSRRGEFDPNSPQMQQMIQLMQEQSAKARALVAEVRAALPELSGAFAAMPPGVFDTPNAVPSLVHEVLLPHIRALLAGEPDIDALGRVFDVLEHLATYSDAPHLQIPAHVALMLSQDVALARQAQPYMGPVTAQQVAEAWARHEHWQRAAAEQRAKPRDVMPRPPGAARSYPKFGMMRDNAVLMTICDAVFAAGSSIPMVGCWWEGDTFYVNNNEGDSGAITFTGGDLVGCVFGHESERSPFSRRDAYDPLLLVRGMPQRLRRVAEAETLGFLLQEFRGQTLPLVTCVFWSEGDRLAAVEPWPDVMANGAFVFESLLLPHSRALEEFADDYGFSDTQLRLVRTLHRRWRQADGEPVRLTTAERALMLAEGTDRDDAMHAVITASTGGQPVPPEALEGRGLGLSRALLADVGILWPEEFETEDVPPAVEPQSSSGPWPLTAMPALGRDEILRRLDALHAAADEDGSANVGELMLAYKDDQADVDLLFARYGDSPSQSIRSGLKFVASLGFRPSRREPSA